ncbi:MAG: hypothetical protein AAF634_04080 [Bacteroidota bacterium]
MRLLNIFSILLLSLFVLGGCSSSGGDDDTPPGNGGGDDDNPSIPDPSAATLVFPEDNTECNTGIVDPGNASLSTVTFEWNAASNADSYTVTVTNLNTNNSIFTNSSTTEADITIERGTPYSWFVTSRAQGTTTTADSAIFRFYNEGPGIENYAPFPAEAIRPGRGENFSSSTNNVDLEWAGADIDDDIEEYEVFFGTAPEPTNSLGIQATNSISDVAVSDATVYYWQVITRDSFGNSSTSEIFSFRIN